MGAGTPAATVASAPPVRVATSAPPRPRNFVAQKWRVVKTGLVVSATEHPDSREVRTLRDGEIVESVGPPFTLPTGVVRLEIAHPSSAAYPNPIGWVSHDEKAIGGGRCLEPGPQPTQGAQPPLKGGGWRPKGKGKGGRGKGSRF